MRRGEIYWVESIAAVGSEQKERRPGVIIQNDIGNAHSTITIVAYLTSKEKFEFEAREMNKKRVGQDSK
jgi:mRNA interferase MazF